MATGALCIDFISGGVSYFLGFIETPRPGPITYGHIKYYSGESCAKHTKHPKLHNKSGMQWHDFISFMQYY